jgi:uncharacterized membrane protein YfcA
MFDSLYLTLGEPFAGVSPWAVAAIALIYFICFMARGAIGFGALAPSVTFSSYLLPPHHAVLLAVIAATIPQLQLLPRSWRRTDWPVAKPVLIAMAISTAVGALIDSLKLLDRAIGKHDIRAPWLAFTLASASGIVNGLAGAGGMIAIVVYLKHACRDHFTLRDTTITLGTLVLCWRFALTFAAGMVTLKLFTEAMLMLPVIYAGVLIGTHYTRDLSPKRYHAILTAFLLVSALGLLVDGLWKVL